MASLSNFVSRSKIRVQSAELTQQSMLQKLVEHGCIDLSSWIDPGGYSELPRHGGGYGDIYRGKMRDGRDIAVKVWRRFTDVDPSIVMKRCMREIYTWSKLKHENIHELLGITQHLGQLGMVSAWMAHGDLWTYILNNPDANRDPWCIQVATGVLYLHTNETVHGDLKACNILLSSDLVTKISDFDSSMATENSMTFSATRELRNTLRWTAPELLNDCDDDEFNTIQKTKQSDIYALAMTLLEVKTGRCPYAEYRDNNRILRALLERRPPKRPKEIDEFSDGRPLWDLLTRCWDHNPAARPSAQSVLQLLKVEIEPPKDEVPLIQYMLIMLLESGCVNLFYEMDPTQKAATLVNEGGSGVIWKGQLYNQEDIAIKVVRISVFEQCNCRILQYALHEVHRWSRLDHPNIHSPMGIILFKGDSIGIVSRWMYNGDLHGFMRKNPNFDRYQKCIEVTSGLEYIHRVGLVHGDIKAANVLVSADGIAKLTGFDFSSVLANNADSVLTEDGNAYNSSVRWAAPELLKGGVTTEQTDIYALGMTMLEIFTGEVPYPDCQTDMAVARTVIQGLLPNRQLGSINMWQLMLRCWNRDPAARPTAAEVLKSLNHLASPHVWRY